MGRQGSVRSIALGAFMLAALSWPAAAQDPIRAQMASAWFAGLGGSANSVDLSQDLTAISANTQVSILGIPLATGTAGGAGLPFHGTENTLAPEAQLGYFAHFTDSAWLWGFKFNYQYLGTTTSNRDIAIPAVQLAPTVFSPDLYQEHFVVGSAETRVTHQLALFPFLGRSFASGFVYGGGG